MIRRETGKGEYLIGVTITVLFVVILSLVVFAARGYQFAVTTQDNNSNTRAVVSYVVNCVQDSRSGTASVEDRDGTECLIIPSSQGYEQRLYLSDGFLREEFVEKSMPLDPQNALSIGETSSFTLEMDEGSGLLMISTDHGAACVNTVHR